MRHVFIYGTGLIGGSIALAIRKNHDVQITAYDINEDSSQLAKKLGIIDNISTNMVHELSQADLVILATPVSQTEKILESFISIPWKAGTIITDVGSTKQAVMQKAAQTIKGNVHFIGGHPMAGSHKSGPASAKAHLFENAFYLLTPFSDTADAELLTLQDWLQGTKASFLSMSAEEHDQITGVISHFPHLIAASLVRKVADYSQTNNTIPRLAAGGFKDITRIASSSPIMWRDITIKNSQVLVSLLDDWIQEMQSVRDLMISQDEQAIFQYFSQAKQFRDGFPSGAKGAIDGLYDLYLDIPDQTGVISHVTTILAIEKISISNIKIIEMREDILGVLRISLPSERDRQQALAKLQSCHYAVYILS